MKDTRYKIQDTKAWGFTLIEMVIVIGILAILAGMLLAIVNPREQIMKANDARRKEDLAQVQRGLEQYYADRGQYPTNSPSNNGLPYRIEDFNGNVVNWGTSWAPYMNLLPKDPDGTKQYVYFSSADHQKFWLYARIDRGERDPKACDSGSPCQSMAPNGVSATSCGGGGVCNYGISSPNTTP